MVIRLEMEKYNAILIERQLKYQSTLSSSKIEKYEFLTDKEILLSDQKD